MRCEHLWVRLSGCQCVRDECRILHCGVTLSFLWEGGTESATVPGRLRANDSMLPISTTFQNSKQVNLNLDSSSRRTVVKPTNSGQKLSLLFWKPESTGTRCRSSRKYSDRRRSTPQPLHLSETRKPVVMLHQPRLPLPAERRILGG